MTVPGVVAGAKYSVASSLTLATSPPITINSVAGRRDLVVDWDIRMTATRDSDTATFRIHNLSVALRKPLEFVGRSIAASLPIPFLATFGVGWGLTPIPLFAGGITSVIPDIRTPGMPGTICEIEAAVGGRETRDTPPQGGAVVGMAAQQYFALLAGQLALIPSPAAIAVVAEKAAQVPVLTWNLTGDGEPREQLDDFMATLGLAWGVAFGNQLVVYRNGLRNDLPPVILNPNTGLISAHTEGSGVVFEALADATAIPGAQISIQVPTVPSGIGLVPVGSPAMRIDEVQFTGSSIGPSTMRGTARKLQVI